LSIKPPGPHLSITTTRKLPKFRRFVTGGGQKMLQQLWDSFIMLIPVFFLLTMIFGAGFYIGRVSKKE
jgi:hypothetical protein